MAREENGRKPRRWKNMSRIERYAFLQSQALFLVLYGVAAYLVAVNLGVGIAALVFGGGILCGAAGVTAGRRRRRNRPR